jgi:hypothetical protein
MVFRDARLTICSALLYTLAFNFTFFIQELFLVLPKAFTPGLRPTLFHNNHTWQGEHPLASLFQGTGALAIFVMGLACAWLVRRPSDRPATMQLLLIWTAYNGFFQSLPQAVLGAFNPQNDVGMAFQYLHLSATARTIVAISALTALPLIASWLARQLLRLANGRGQAGFMFSIATLPALAAIPLIILFRVPRNIAEVAVVPAVVTLVGVTWMQVSAPWLRAEASGANAQRYAVAYPLAAVLILLLMFHLVLRRGIPFF